jgi:hypothetical protein
MISRDSRNVTFSPGSADGHAPCKSRAGQKTARSGREAALVSPSLMQAKDSVTRTRVTFGHSSRTSSDSAVLQSSLASRLRARLGVNGSPEFSLIWKEWPIHGQAPICALRASGRRTSGKDSSGWPSPKASDSHGGTIGRATRSDGRDRGPTLNDAALLAPWPTPMAGTPARNGNNEAGNTDSSRRTVALVGWNTPHCPRAHDSDHSASTYLDRQLGATSQPCDVRTGKRAVLNPAHSRWLMGYPVEWDYYGAMAMRSSRKSRQNSSGPTSNPRGNV